MAKNVSPTTIILNKTKDVLDTIVQSIIAKNACHHLKTLHRTVKQALFNSKATRPGNIFFLLARLLPGGITGEEKAGLEWSFANRRCIFANISCFLLNFNIFSIWYYPLQLNTFVRWIYNVLCSYSSYMGSIVLASLTLKLKPFCWTSNLAFFLHSTPLYRIALKSAYNFFSYIEYKI